MTERDKERIDEFFYEYNKTSPVASMDYLTKVYFSNINRLEWVWRRGLDIKSFEDPGLKPGWI